MSPGSSRWMKCPAPSEDRPDLVARNRLRRVRRPDRSARFTNSRLSRHTRLSQAGVGTQKPLAFYWIRDLRTDSKLVPPFCAPASPFSNSIQPYLNPIKLRISLNCLRPTLIG